MFFFLFFSLFLFVLSIPIRFISSVILSLLPDVTIDVTFFYLQDIDPSGKDSSSSLQTGDSEPHSDDSEVRRGVSFFFLSFNMPLDSILCSRPSSFNSTW